MTNGWKGDLTSVLRQISRLATGGGSLYVMAASARLALALPGDRRAARVIADLYQPQRQGGKLFLHAAKAAIACGIARRFPTYQGSANISPQVNWLTDAATNRSVGFLGCNPSHGPRCVLAGIDPISDDKFVAKLGLDRSAAAVRNEAAILEKLKGRYPGVVSSRGLEDRRSNDGQALDTTELPCQLTDSGPASFDWALLRLPHLGCDSPATMVDRRVLGLLVQWLGGESVLLDEIPWACALIDQIAIENAPPGWHAKMRSRRIRTALFHGDFAVWNLRVTHNGLVAIDWEWGQEDGVAGIDLVHGLRQECYMVRGMKAEPAVAWMLKQASSPMWSDYLDVCGWQENLKDWLRLGLLHSHFNALNSSIPLLEALDIHLR